MNNLETLWAYQEAEQQLMQIENTIRSTPSRVKLNQLHKLLKTQQAAITKLNEDATVRAQQFDRLLEQIAKLEERLQLEVSELENLQQDEESTAEEMAELRADVERLSREINAAMRDAKSLQQAMEKTVEEYQSTRVSAGKAKREYDQLRVVCETEREESAGELEKRTAELEKIGKTVEPALMEKYKKVKLHHAQPIAKVIHSKCSGCNMSLPMVVLKKLATENTVVECENCGRILFSESK